MTDERICHASIGDNTWCTLPVGHAGDHGGVLHYAQPDDLTHYMEACSRLTAESASLRTQLEEANRRAEQAHDPLDADFTRYLDLQQQLEAAREQVKAMREALTVIAERSSFPTMDVNINAARTALSASVGEGQS